MNWRVQDPDVKEAEKMPSGDTPWSRYLNYFIEAAEKNPREVRMSYEQWAEANGEPKFLGKDPEGAA